MFPDSNWINALKLPTQVMLGLLVACSILLVLDAKSIISLSDFGSLAKPIVIILLVFSGSLSVTGIGAFIKDQLLARKKQSLLAGRQELKAKERLQKKTEAEASAIARIEHLSSKELRYLANCLREESQSFYTYVHSPPVATLMEKGLVYTPGGTHHQDHYPFTVADFAWKVLLERKAEILEKDGANQAKEAQEKRRGRY